MTYKQELPVKYCLTCDTHFHAPPNIHNEVYHQEEFWSFVRGDFRKAMRADKYGDDSMVRVFGK